MKILHTSDWHLGVSQEQSPREEEHKLFLDWLIEQLIERDVDVLLHGGDTFHYMQPSAKCLKLYYEFLARCAVETNLRQIVITGGNHDSPSRLDAPRSILQSLQVHVVGGMLADESTWHRCLCPIKDKDGQVEAVIVAVPYIHESRLGIITTGQRPTQIRDDMITAFSGLYSKLADLAQATYPGVPIVTTGHLTCYPEGRGVVEGDFYTPIHLVEALGSLPPTIFDLRYSYVGLGHIHKMFDIPGPNAWYPGSPVPTDIIEARTERYVLMVEVDPEKPDRHSTVEKVVVPDYRAIFELIGPPDEIIPKIKALTWDQALPPYLYVDFDVPAPMPDGLIQVEEALKSFDRAVRPKVVRYRENLLPDENNPVLPEDFRHVPLADMSPTEVFEKMYKIKHGAAPTPDILAAFSSLLTEELD